MRYFTLIVVTALWLSGCMTVAKTTGKAVALPFQATYAVGKTTGKAVIGTGKAVYYVGSVPVKISDKALDTTTDMLVVTKTALDTAGSVMKVTRTIKAAQLDAELDNIRRAGNLIEVVIDVAA
ncbi:MAG: hypothetical protein WBG08_08315 [Litorimonas sp.]